MKLHITEKAYHKLNDLNQDRNKILALTYDTEGCGCGVNGMPTFLLVSEAEENTEEVDCDQYTVTVHKQQATFFAEEMKLDYNGATFRLSSPNEMLNPFINTASVTAGE